VAPPIPDMKSQKRELCKMGGKLYSGLYRRYFNINDALRFQIFDKQEDKTPKHSYHLSEMSAIFQEMGSAEGQLQFIADDTAGVRAIRFEDEKWTENGKSYRVAIYLETRVKANGRKSPIFYYTNNAHEAKYIVSTISFHALTDEQKQKGAAMISTIEKIDAATRVQKFVYFIRLAKQKRSE
jgi:hypothetical protein